MQEKTPYDPKKIEEKWVKNWEDSQIFVMPLVKDFTAEQKKKKKLHVLDMLPYPSGEGLHTGHAKIFGASDIYSRMKRMQGYNVLHVTGWDAFGLPAEQFAIKNKINPKISTKKNSETYEKQMKMLGLSYDWSRTSDTTDPNFYKWTQWIFKQLYKDGLCYESFEPINWCTSCKTGLANEDLEDGKCERCGSVVEKKPIRQWVIKITEYAEKLLSGVDNLDWKESIKEMQRNWIGKSEGAEIDFKIKAGDVEEKFTIFTTRPDTLFGCTYCVLSPEHKLVREYLDKNLVTNSQVAEKYLEEVKNKTEIERTALGKEKTGVKLEGVVAINPANEKQIPIYIADYVLANYGTGAIMAVPAHDERDGEFADKFGIEKVDVVLRRFVLGGANTPKPGVETLYRTVIDAIIENDKGEFLLMKEVNNGVTNIHFVGGGIEEGDSEIETVKKEILEETGYSDIEINSKSICYFSITGFRQTKNKNQDTTGRFFHVKLNSENKVKSEVDEGKHEIFWAKKEDVASLVNWEGHLAAWYEFLKNRNYLYTENGILINSGKFDGMDSQEAKKKITEFVGGKMVTKYKLRDWVFARQRYWGEPFPIVFDENHKSYLVADSELPVVLPDVESYEPTGNGESPLADIKEFTDVYGYINSENEFVSCDKNDSKAKLFKRETNTMPQWAGSSWYWLRYMDPKNQNRFVGKEDEEYWNKDSGVDIYLGGMEHATRHLIYGRFWQQFLYDKGYLSISEPFKRLEAVGLVLGKGGVKMSKRLGNVINPDDVVKQFGADTLRLYIAFAGDYHDSFAWDEKAIIGPRRFIERIWEMQYKIAEVKLSDELEILLNQTIKKVTEDYESLKFNTAVAQMMILVNALDKESKINTDSYKTLLKLLAPICPFVTEEIYANLNEKNTIHFATWPQFDENKIKNKTVNIAIQVNGKLRETFSCAADLSDVEVLQFAENTEGYKKWVTAKPKKVIVIKNKIVNVVL